ncbi:hypothetical protein [Streptomyces sp. NBC_00038]|uniref:hypothetical protein n=1 Tax=Streptomyces sp. NBC_00038 TaxID=2903615 RepID=UPI002254D140|nr:hypothetical protein [Streptomyces sp. NBC_00038]MCX5559493.1 hypothetical protein [Streptomyces sp. NBC_00038]
MTALEEEVARFRKQVGALKREVSDLHIDLAAANRVPQSDQDAHADRQHPEEISNYCHTRALLG